MLFYMELQWSSLGVRFQAGISLLLGECCFGQAGSWVARGPALPLYKWEFEMLRMREHELGVRDVEVQYVGHVLQKGRWCSCSSSEGCWYPIYVLHPTHFAVGRGITEGKNMLRVRSWLHWLQVEVSQDFTWRFSSVESKSEFAEIFPKDHLRIAQLSSLFTELIT